MPVLSIITINYNNLQGLKKTMQSVFDQTFTDYEYIIIDGGSTDGSIEYIKEHATKLSHVVCEKDNGIYDALNKGSRLAGGTYLHHLNSGDAYYEKNSLELLFKTFPTEDFVYCNQDLPGHFLKEYPSILNYSFFCRDAVPHQATIIKRSFFETAGPFSETYSMGGDYKFFLEAVLVKQCSYRHAAVTLVAFDMNGVSSLQAERLRQEFKTIREKTIPNLVQEFEILYAEKRRLDLLENSRTVKCINWIRKKLGQ